MYFLALVWARFQYNVLDTAIALAVGRGGWGGGGVRGRRPSYGGIGTQSLQRVTLIEIERNPVSMYR